MISTVAVLVPVRNEEALISRCISNLQAAIAELDALLPDITVVVIFALDHCTDDSEMIIANAGYMGVRSLREGVGSARGSAAEAILGGSSQSDLARIWLANTDADSAVPWNWLVHQIDLADAGADVVVGAVRPDPTDLDDVRNEAWGATHDSGQAHGHVHGANLGIRASTYERAGGFARAFEHEDVELVDRTLRIGANVVASNSHTVLTSGRLLGRTAGGYAGYLREQLVPLAAALLDDANSRAVVTAG